MNTTDLINEMISLPVEERARVADALLSSLNPPDDIHTQAWLTLAQQRLDEINTGKTQPLPGEAVFKRIRARYSK